MFQTGRKAARTVLGSKRDKSTRLLQLEANRDEVHNPSRPESRSHLRLDLLGLRAPRRSLTQRNRGGSSRYELVLSLRVPYEVSLLCFAGRPAGFFAPSGCTASSQGSSPCIWLEVALQLSPSVEWWHWQWKAVDDELEELRLM